MLAVEGCGDWRCPARRFDPADLGKTKEVLRLRNEVKAGQRQIAGNCSLAVSTMHEYLKRAASD